MTLQVTAHSYHLRYAVDEDRILVSVDISPEHELAMPMTRRLTRNLLAAMAKMASDRGPASVPAGAPPLVRDTILDFEHSQSVATAVAEGHMRNEPPREKPPSMPMPMRLVREVKLVPRNNGGIALVFENGEQQLILEIAPERIHMVIETFVQMAERAGWHFPPIASWLDPAKAAASPPQGKALN
jgi:hypothetical protein